MRIVGVHLEVRGNVSFKQVLGRMVCLLPFNKNKKYSSLNITNQHIADLDVENKIVTLCRSKCSAHPAVICMSVLRRECLK